MEATNCGFCRIYWKFPQETADFVAFTEKTFLETFIFCEVRFFPIDIAKIKELDTYLYNFESGCFGSVFPGLPESLSLINSVSVFEN